MGAYILKNTGVLSIDQPDVYIMVNHRMSLIFLKTSKSEDEEYLKLWFMI